ncbi:sensor histidine kinase [Clostridium aminobutyricum]|uniref:GHKL domain-containing protein n=1 Tax=Clostridium aminobutyricum TaxID=33953 RepID=A0A939D5Y3_CLOAM|nr:GHKL domain-containing protein [Clostridium aminobutyricum]MBN7771949.1 GHKL domain-containing protein [Clostridium aminobutyricum]
MTFTQDIFGSFVEMISTVTLMNLFNQEYLRNKIRLISACIVISVIVAILDLLETPSLSLLYYVIMITILSIAINRNTFQILFELVFASAFLTFIEYILAVIFYKIQGIESLTFISVCIQLVITFTICASLGFNSKLQIKFQLLYENYKDECYLIGSTLFCFSMIEVFLWKSNNEMVLGQSAIISAYTAIWFALCIYLLKKLIENRRQKENIHLHEQYMETTENLLDSLYSDKHDFNKHLQAILGMCQFQQSEEAVKEIQRYIEALQEKSSNKKKSAVSFNTGNGVVNALLYSKAKEAEKREVQLFHFPSGIFPVFPCEQYELVQIIGNLLDNAFEYVEGLEKEQRIVVLFIGEQENQKQIEVRNTYCEEKNRTISISQTAKLGERRGYGLKNVRAIASKYHGKLNIFQEENEFVVEVLF